jgi:hypothetical protein
MKAHPPKQPATGLANVVARAGAWFVVLVDLLKQH